MNFPSSHIAICYPALPHPSFNCASTRRIMAESNPHHHEDDTHLHANDDDMEDVVVYASHSDAPVSSVGGKSGLDLDISPSPTEMQSDSQSTTTHSHGPSHTDSYDSSESSSIHQHSSYQPSHPSHVIDEPYNPLSICWTQVSGLLSKLSAHILLAFILGNMCVLNLWLGYTHLEVGCPSLSKYCIGIGFLFGICILLTGLHYRHGAQLNLASLLRRYPMIGSLVCLSFPIVLMVFSSIAIARLILDDCSYLPAIRQMALTNIVVVFTVCIASFAYFLLQCLCPSLRYSGFFNRTGKSILLLLCVATCIMCIVNAATRAPRSKGQSYCWVADEDVESIFVIWLILDHHLRLAYLVDLKC